MCRPVKRKRKKQFRLWLSEKEHENLEFICGIHGVSMTQAVRTCLRATFIQLGLETGIEEAIENKLSRSVESGGILGA